MKRLTQKEYDERLRRIVRTRGMQRRCKLLGALNHRWFAQQKPQGRLK